MNTLKEGTITKNDNYTIRSKNYKVSLCKINKISLSCYDDKRHILEDGITSYAHGHYKVKKYIKWNYLYTFFNISLHFLMFFYIH